MNNINTLAVIFKNNVNTSDLTKFRGAILAALGEEKSVLYHNHLGDGYRYSYPLVQYKRIQNRAAMLCIKEGVESIGEFFSRSPFVLNIGGKEEEFTIENVKPERVLVQTWDEVFRYRINRWLPLNTENYKEYMKLEALADKIEFLERILTANILSFAKGVGVQVEKQLECRITTLSEPILVRNKNTKLMAFDIQFRANISLPQYIGIGKNASIGFGVLTKVIDRK